MTIAFLEKQLKPLENPVAGVFSKWLYQHLPPGPIDNRQTHQKYSKAVSLVMRALIEEAFSDVDREQVEEYLRAIGSFIDEYEKNVYHSADSTPEQMLRFLMAQNNLSQYDVAEDLGGQPVVSAILRGKRKLTREHIERLSARFNVSPAAFYPAA